MCIDNPQVDFKISNFNNFLYVLIILRKKKKKNMFNFINKYTIKVFSCVVIIEQKITI